MANDFYYSLSLCINHESIDPQVISNAITHLTPEFESRAGRDVSRRSGIEVNRGRVAARSVWIARLHEENRLYSGIRSLSDAIEEEVDKLRYCKKLFRDIRKNGVINLVVWVFMISNFAAEVITVEAIAACVRLGIDIELNVIKYSNDSDASSTDTQAE